MKDYQEISDEYKEEEDLLTASSTGLGVHGRFAQRLQLGLICFQMRTPHPLVGCCFMSSLRRAQVIIK